MLYSAVAWMVHHACMLARCMHACMLACCMRHAFVCASMQLYSRPTLTRCGSLKPTFNIWLERLKQLSSSGVQVVQQLQFPVTLPATTRHQTAPQVASSSGWLEGELESSCALGLVYEQLRQPDAAVACHERCLMLALSGPDGEGAGVALADEARWTLVHVYAQQVGGCSDEKQCWMCAAFI